MLPEVPQFLAGMATQVSSFDPEGMLRAVTPEGWGTAAGSTLLAVVLGVGGLLLVGGKALGLLLPLPLGSQWVKAGALPFLGGAALLMFQPAWFAERLPEGWQTGVSLSLTLVCGMLLFLSAIRFARSLVLLVVWGGLGLTFFSLGFPGGAQDRMKAMSSIVGDVHTSFPLKGLPFEGSSKGADQLARIAVETQGKLPSEESARDDSAVPVHTISRLFFPNTPG